MVSYDEENMHPIARGFCFLANLAMLETFRSLKINKIHKIKQNWDHRLRMEMTKKGNTKTISMEPQLWMFFSTSMLGITTKIIVQSSNIFNQDF